MADNWILKMPSTTPHFRISHLVLLIFLFIFTITCITSSITHESSFNESVSILNPLAQEEDSTSLQDYDDYDRIIRTTHFFPHSHTDAGWLKSYHRYYTDSVRNIITTVINSLLQHPDRRFIWVDFLYFSTFYFETTPQIRAKVDYLIKNNQFDLANGGMTMNDAAVVKSDSFFHDMHHGLQFIYQQFGKKIQYGWSIDPFGVSASELALWSQMGYKWVVLQRNQEQLKASMSSIEAQSPGTQYVWKPHGKTLGDSSGIFIEYWHDYYVGHWEIDKHWTEFPRHTIIGQDIWKYILYGSSESPTGQEYNNIIQTINLNRQQPVLSNTNENNDSMYNSIENVTIGDQYILTLRQIISRNTELQSSHNIATDIDTSDLQTLLDYVLSLRGLNTTTPISMSAEITLENTLTHVQSLVKKYAAISPLIPLTFSLSSLSSSVRSKVITSFDRRFQQLLYTTLSLTRSTSTLFHVSTPFGADFSHQNSFVTQYGMDFFCDYINNIQHYSPPQIFNSKNTRKQPNGIVSPNNGNPFESIPLPQSPADRQTKQKCLADEDFINLAQKLDEFDAFICIHHIYGLIVRIQAPQLWKTVQLAGTDKSLKENTTSALNKRRNAQQTEKKEKKIDEPNSLNSSQKRKESKVRPYRVALAYPWVEFVAKFRQSTNDEYFTAIQHEVQQSWILHNDANFQSTTNSTHKTDIHLQEQIQEKSRSDQNETINFDTNTSPTSTPLNLQKLTSSNEMHQNQLHIAKDQHVIDIYKFFSNLSTPAPSADQIPISTVSSLSSFSVSSFQSISETISTHFHNPLSTVIIPQSYFPFSLSPFHSPLHSHYKSILLDHFFTKTDYVKSALPRIRFPLVATPTTRNINFIPYQTDQLSTSSLSHPSPFMLYALPSTPSDFISNSLSLPIHPILFPTFGVPNLFPMMDTWWGRQDQRWWSGYYTSRSWIKESERAIQTSLQAVETLATFAGSMDHTVPLFTLPLSKTMSGQNVSKDNKFGQTNNYTTAFIDNGRYIFGDLFTQTAFRQISKQVNTPTASGEVTQKYFPFSQMLPYYTASERLFIQDSMILYGCTTCNEYDFTPAIHITDTDVHSVQIQLLNSHKKKGTTNTAKMPPGSGFGNGFSQGIISSSQSNSSSQYIQDFISNALGSEAMSKFMPMKYPKFSTTSQSHFASFSSPFDSPMELNDKTTHLNNASSINTNNSTDTSSPLTYIETSSQCASLTPFEQSHLGIIRQIVSILQHHDAITATSPLTTMQDYYMQIVRASESIDNLFSLYISDLLNLPRYTAGSTAQFLNEFDQIIREIKGENLSKNAQNENNGINQQTILQSFNITSPRDFNQINTNNDDKISSNTNADIQTTSSRSILDEIFDALPSIDTSHTLLYQESLLHYHKSKQHNEKRSSTNSGSDHEANQSSIRLLFSQTGSQSLAGSKCKYNYETKRSTLQPTLIPLVLYNPTSTVIQDHIIKLYNITTSDVVLLDSTTAPIYSELVSVLFDGTNGKGKANQNKQTPQSVPPPSNAPFDNISSSPGHSGRLYGGEEVILPPLPLLSSHDLINSLPEQLWATTQFKQALSNLSGISNISNIPLHDLKTFQAYASRTKKFHGYYNTFQQTKVESESIHNSDFHTKQSSLWANLTKITDLGNLNESEIPRVPFTPNELSQLLHSVLEPSFNVLQCPIVQSELSATLRYHSPWFKNEFSSLIDAFTQLEPARQQQLFNDLGIPHTSINASLFTDPSQYFQAAQTIHAHFPYIIPKYNLFSAPITLKPMELKIVWMALNTKQGPCCDAVTSYHVEPGLYTYQPPSPPKIAQIPLIERYSLNNQYHPTNKSSLNDSSANNFSLCHFPLGAGIGLDQYCNLSSPFPSTSHAPILLGLPWNEHFVHPVGSSTAPPPSTSTMSSNHTSPVSPYEDKSTLVSAGICHQSISNGRTTLTMTGSCGYSLDNTNVPIYTVGGTTSLLIQQTNIKHIHDPYDFTLDSNNTSNFKNFKNDSSLQYNSLHPSYLHDNLPDYYKYYPHAFITSHDNNSNSNSSNNNNNNNNRNEHNLDLFSPRPSEYSIPVITPISIQFIKEQADSIPQAHYTYSNDNYLIPQYPLHFDDILHEAVITYTKSQTYSAKNNISNANVNQNTTSSSSSSSTPFISAKFPQKTDFMTLVELFTGFTTPLEVDFETLLTSLPLQKLQSLSQQFILTSYNTCNLFTPFDFHSPTFQYAFTMAINNYNSVYRYGDISPHIRYALGTYPLPQAQSISPSIASTFPSFIPSQSLDSPTQRAHRGNPGDSTFDASGTRTVIFKGLIVEMVSIRTWESTKLHRLDTTQIQPLLNTTQAFLSYIRGHQILPKTTTTTGTADTPCYCSQITPMIDNVLLYSSSPLIANYLFPECPCYHSTPSVLKTNGDNLSYKHLLFIQSDPNNIPPIMTQNEKNRYNRWSNSRQGEMYSKTQDKDLLAQKTVSFIKTYRIFRPTDGIDFGMIVNLGLREPLNLLLRVQTGIENSLSTDGSRQTDSYRHSIYVDDLGYNLIQKLYTRINKAHGNHFPFVTQAGIKDEYPEHISSPSLSMLNDGQLNALYAQFQSNIFSNDTADQAKTLTRGEQQNVNQDITKINSTTTHITYDPIQYSLSVPRGYEYIPNHILYSFVNFNSTNINKGNNGNVTAQHRIKSVYPSSKLYGIRQLMLISSRSGGITPSAQGTFDIMIGRYLQSGDSLGVAEGLCDTNTVNYQGVLIFDTNSISRNINQVHSNQVAEVANHNSVDLRKIEALQVQTHHIKSIIQYLIFSTFSNLTPGNVKQTNSTQTHLSNIIDDIVTKYLSISTLTSLVQSRSSSIINSDQLQTTPFSEPFGLFADSIGTNINSIYSWLIDSSSSSPIQDTTASTTSNSYSHPILSRSISSIAQFFHLLFSPNAKTSSIEDIVAQINYIDQTIPQQYQYPLNRIGTGLIGVGVRGLLYNPVQFSYVSAYRNFYTNSKKKILFDQLGEKIISQNKLSPSYRNFTTNIRNSIQKARGYLPFLEHNIIPGDVHYTSTLAYTTDKRDSIMGFTLYRDKMLKARESRITLPSTEHFFPFMPHIQTESKQLAHFSAYKYQPQLVATVFGEWSKLLSNKTIVQPDVLFNTASIQSTQNISQNISDVSIIQRLTNLPQIQKLEVHPKHLTEMVNLFTTAQLSSFEQEFSFHGQFTPLAPQESENNDAFFDPAVFASNEQSVHMVHYSSPMHLASDAAPHLGYAPPTVFSSFHYQTDASLANTLAIASRTSWRSQWSMVTYEEIFPYTTEQKEMLQTLSKLTINSSQSTTAASSPLNFTATFSLLHDLFDPKYPDQIDSFIATLLENKITFSIKDSRDDFSSYLSNFLSRYFFFQYGAETYPTQLYDVNTVTNSTLKQQFLSQKQQDDTPRYSTFHCLNAHLNFGQYRYICENYNAVDNYVTASSRMSIISNPPSTAAENRSHLLYTLPFFKSFHTFSEQHLLYILQHKYIGNINQQQVVTTRHESFSSIFIFNTLLSPLLFDSHPSHATHTSESSSKTQIYSQSREFAGFSQQDLIDGLTSALFSPNGFYTGSSASTLCTEDNFRLYSYRYSNPVLTFFTHPIPILLQNQTQINHSTIRILYNALAQTGLNSMKMILNDVHKPLVPDAPHKWQGKVQYQNFNYAYFLPRSSVSSVSSVSSSSASNPSPVISLLNIPVIIPKTSYTPYLSTKLEGNQNKISHINIQAQNDDMQDIMRNVNTDNKFLNSNNTLRNKNIPNNNSQCVIIQTISPQCNLHSPDYFRASMLPNGQADAVLHYDISNPKITTSPSYLHVKSALQHPSITSSPLPITFTLQSLRSNTLYTSTMSNKRMQAIQRPTPLLGYGLQSARHVYDNSIITHFIHQNIYSQFSSICILDESIDNQKKILLQLMYQYTATHQYNHSTRSLLTGQYDGMSPLSSSAYNFLSFITESNPSKTTTTIYNQICNTISNPFFESVSQDMAVSSDFDHIGVVSNLSSTSASVSASVATNNLSSMTIFNDIMNQLYDNSNIVQFWNSDHIAQPFSRTLDAYSLNIYDILMKTYLSFYPVTFTSLLQHKVHQLQQDPFVFALDKKFTTILSPFTAIPLHSIHGTAFPFKVSQEQVQTVLPHLLLDTITKYSNATNQTNKNKASQSTCIPLPPPSSSTPTPTFSATTPLLHQARITCPSLPQYQTAQSINFVGQQSETFFTPRLFSDMHLYNAHHHSYYKFTPIIPFQHNSSIKNISPDQKNKNNDKNSKRDKKDDHVNQSQRNGISTSLPVVLSVPIDFPHLSVFNRTANRNDTISLQFDTFEQCTNSLHMILLSVNTDGQIIQLKSSLGQSILSTITKMSSTSQFTINETETDIKINHTTQGDKNRRSMTVARTILLGEWISATFGTFDPNQTELSSFYSDYYQLSEKITQDTKSESLFNTVYSHMVDRITYNPFCYCNSVAHESISTHSTAQQQRIYPQTAQNDQPENTIFHTITSTQSVNSINDNSTVFFQMPLTNAFNPYRDAYFVPINPKSSIFFQQSLLAKLKPSQYQSYQTVLYTNTLYQDSYHLQQLGVGNFINTTFENNTILTTLDYVMSTDTNTAESSQIMNTFTPSICTAPLSSITTTTPTVSQIFNHTNNKITKTLHPMFPVFTSILSIADPSLSTPFSSLNFETPLNEEMNPVSDLFTLQNTNNISFQNENLWHQTIALSLFDTPTNSFISHHTTLADVQAQHVFHPYLFAVSQPVTNTPNRGANKDKDNTSEPSSARNQPINFDMKYTNPWTSFIPPDLFQDQDEEKNSHNSGPSTPVSPGSSSQDDSNHGKHSNNTNNSIFVFLVLAAILFIINSYRTYKAGKCSSSGQQYQQISNSESNQDHTDANQITRTYHREDETSDIDDLSDFDSIDLEIDPEFDFNYNNQIHKSNAYPNSTMSHSNSKLTQTKLHSNLDSIGQTSPPDIHMDIDSNEVFHISAATDEIPGPEFNTLL